MLWINAAPIITTMPNYERQITSRLKEYLSMQMASSKAFTTQSFAVCTALLAVIYAINHARFFAFL